MKTTSLLKWTSIFLFGAALVGCNCKTKTMTEAMKAPYEKKYTNADYYTNGKFNQDVALTAMLDMFDYYGVVYDDFLKQNLWVVDFGMGDFENVGMGGVFWVNDSIHNYFGHEIYLLPGQMIAEHRHVPSNFAAKHETWLTREGMVYNYSIGEPTPGGPKLPESQKEFITVSHFVEQPKGGINTLVESESRHFLIAGPNGAIVTEFGSYHDNAGLRFTNPAGVL